MKLTLMADRYNYIQSVNDIREEWLEELLAFIGIDTSKAEEIDKPAFTEYLIKNNVDIVEYQDIGALSVEHDGEIVGEWGGPILKMKKDKVTGDLYYEITIEYWSIIEEDIFISFP